MTTEDLMKLLGDFPEINPSNYGDDDVNALNAWGIAAHTALEALGREVAELKQKMFDESEAMVSIVQVKYPQALAERDQARAELAAIRATQGPLSADDVQWVVNDNAELGVKIGEQFFFLYKGESLVYQDARHDDNAPMMWRCVGKREFGECCYPVKFYKNGATLPERYRDELTFIPGLSFGKKEDSDWKELPASPKIGGV